MNGNTYFNIRFYDPLRVQRQQVAAADSEVQSLRESLASEPRIFRGLQGDFDPHTSYLGTKKYPSFTKSRTCGGLKKRPLLPRNT